MGIKTNWNILTSDMNTTQVHHKTQKMTAIEILGTFLADNEMQLCTPTSMTNDDIWKKFELPTPPLSPRREGEDDLSLEDLSMAFDLDTEDLMLLDDESVAEAMRSLTAETFPETPPDCCLQSNLIQDIMWPAGSKPEDLNNKVTPKEKVEKRSRCDSCSGRPFNPDCVAPEEVFPYEATSISGSISQTRVFGLGTETPSDSEEEIDVVNDVAVEKHCRVTVPARYKSRASDTESEHEKETTKTVTLTIGHKPFGCAQTISKKCSTFRQKVDCPTDVHNYSLPVSSLKRMRSFPSSPDTHKSAKKLKRDLSIPSELRKVAQKLKSSVSCSSRSSSDSEEFCDAGKRTQHNVLERKRRTDLKNSFFHLRDSVPELEGQERAPKVVILRKASQFIHKLNEEGRRHEREIEHLKMKKERLRRQLAKLRDL